MGYRLWLAGDNGRYVGRIELLAGNGSVKLDRYEAIPMDDKIKSNGVIYKRQ